MYTKFLQVIFCEVSMTILKMNLRWIVLLLLLHQSFGFIPVSGWILPDETESLSSFVDYMQMKP